MVVLGPQHPTYGSFGMMHPDSPQWLNVHATNHGRGGPEVSRKRGRRVLPRGVSFAEEALLYSNTRTLEEVNDSWYTKAQLGEFKQNRKDMIRVLKKVAFNLDKVDQEKHCLRGFEPYFSVEVNKATKIARQNVFDVVLEEQQRQRSLGIRDEEAIREIAETASRWARQNGLSLGKQDEKERAAILEQDRRLMESSAASKEVGEGIAREFGDALRIVDTCPEP